jgi:uncharacterized SAM-binding protein YcdF (DUF218 family)
VQLYIAGITPKLVMSGGRADDEPCTAAELMQKYALGAGLPSCDVIEQRDALDTVGEAIFCRLLLPPPLPGRRILLVTNDFHADRAAVIFQFVFGPGWTVNVDRVPDGSAAKSALRIHETESLRAFLNLFSGIRAGDIRAILDRFWNGHSLYRGERFAALRRRTAAAAAALTLA